MAFNAKFNFTNFCYRFYYISMLLHLFIVFFLLDDVRFIVIGQKLAKDAALQKALKV